MRIIQNNLKEVALAFIMGIITALGFIAGIGSIYHGIDKEGWLFIVAGIVGIVDSIYAGYSFYVQFLKPDESGTPNAKK